MGKWSNIALKTGTKIDRFGSEFGQYFSPAGTPMQMSALPSGNSNVYNMYEVVKPFQIQTSKIAPAFGKIGTGTQYYSPLLRANELETSGFIRKIP